MAVLEDIRRKGGIIVSVVIGISLLAFIVGDFVPRGNTSYDVLEINGKSISYQAYEQRVTELTQQYQAQQQRMTGSSSLDENTQEMIRERAWQMMMNEEIATQEYKKVGVTVSPEELFDLIQGPNPSPTIRQIPAFNNRETGEFDRAALISFLKNKNNDPQAAAEWNMVEKELLKERLAQKYINLISKGLFTPNFLVENENNEINRKVDFDYIMKPYSSIADSIIKLKNSDLKKYYDENRQQWEQKTSRDIEYVVFSIVPSDDDRAAGNKWMDKMLPEFAAAADANQFVNLNSNVSSDRKFYKQEELPEQVAHLFNGNLGDISDVYADGDVLKVARLAAIENRPDSVKARSIILIPRQQTETAAILTARADSIKKAIEGGADFTQLALQYSADPSVTTNNGDIGWIQESTAAAGSIFGQFFDLKKGEVLKMETQQGTFIGQVTERGKEVKKVQIATLQYHITPSSRTEQILYSQASKFAMENRTEDRFNETATAQNLNKRVASYLGENDRQIVGLTQARQIVRWAYGAKKGEVSDVFNLSDSYVVAILKDIREKGFAPLQQVQTEVNLNVRKEKKAEQLSATLSEAAAKAASFSDLALQLGLPVESASAITFSSFSVPGVGIEPKLIAAASVLDEGNISQPIEGSNGVFLLTVKQISAPDSASLEQARTRLNSTSVNRSISESMQAINKASNIKDMRSKFY
ncbi:MAG: SurA N-terminal domain-containing protein [Bacteroidales bacterium]|jgi:peptidyl-prolyl cis-trans isomerase D|nr:SurA N-terminal domain-containing protein [Bacteroidales bacterium]